MNALIGTIIGYCFVQFLFLLLHHHNHHASHAQLLFPYNNFPYNNYPFNYPFNGPPPPCGNDECNKHGRCEGSRVAFRCYCDTGWYGPTCEKEDRARQPCGRGDCSNHGNCQGDRAFYQCTCDGGWVGVRCEQVACDARVDCLWPRGICGSGASKAFPNCQCNAGYDGDHCRVIDLNKLPCDRTDCNNHGNCTGTKTSPSCNCDPGWSSVKGRCDMGPCDNSTCSGHGFCLGTSYDNPPPCNCTDPGWIGARCDELPPCIDNSICNNHGQCGGSVIAPSCHCDPGWSTTPGVNPTPNKPGSACNIQDCDVIKNCNNARAPTTCSGTLTHSFHGQEVALVQNPTCHCAPGYRSDPQLGCVVANTDQIACDPRVDCNNNAQSCQGFVTKTFQGGFLWLTPRQVRNYRCNCNPGVGGANCEINDCSNADACNSHGQCSGTPQNHTCKCDPGWNNAPNLGQGDMGCTLPTPGPPACDPVRDCSSHGKCAPNGTQLAPGCVCDPGRTSAHCEEALESGIPSTTTPSPTIIYGYGDYDSNTWPTDAPDPALYPLVGPWNQERIHHHHVVVEVGVNTSSTPPPSPISPPPNMRLGCAQCNYHGACVTGVNGQPACECFAGYSPPLCVEGTGGMVRIHWRVGGGGGNPG